MTWYTRAPTTPPMTIHTAISLNALPSKPRAIQRRSAIHAATSTPIASSRPYACSGIGPRSMTPLSGLGIDARTEDTARHRRGRPPCPLGRVQAIAGRGRYAFDDRASIPAAPDRACRGRERVHRPAGRGWPPDDHQRPTDYPPDDRPG